MNVTTSSQSRICYKYREIIVLNDNNHFSIRSSVWGTLNPCWTSNMAKLFNNLTWVHWPNSLNLNFVCHYWYVNLKKQGHKNLHELNWFISQPWDQNKHKLSQFNSLSKYVQGKVLIEFYLQQQLKDLWPSEKLFLLTPIDLDQLCSPDGPDPCVEPCPYLNSHLANHIQTALDLPLLVFTLFYP